MKKLIYMPLESYKERYTWFMSSVDGWAEDNFKKHGVTFIRVEGEKSEGEIKTGVVLDAFGRSKYSLTQVANVVEMIRDGRIVDGDVIYTEDFWTPGIEALFYIRQLSGINFKIGCFFHAQSVDVSDFTWNMRWWMRPMEKGLTRGYDFIFVTSEILKGLCEQAGFQVDHIHNVGLPYNSSRLIEQLIDTGFVEQEKERFVLFSSRFDREKNPHFFLDLVERCPDINFKLVKPRAKLSNDERATARAEQLASTAKNFEIVDTSEKISYYTLLSKAEVQFNCAIQDWVSWTLLEAVLFKCKPLYPKWKDFPVELAGFEETCLYENRNLDDAEKKLRALMDVPFDPTLNKIVEKHDASWGRYLDIMGI